MKNPREWKEKDFLLWLEENGENLHTGNRTSQDRQIKWHKCFLKSLEAVISHCQCFLDNNVVEDCVDLCSYARTAINKAASLCKNLVSTFCCVFHESGHERCNRTDRGGSLGFKVSLLLRA
jgi:hypothetical protein